jgi:16S rRNA (uracil1498-N3)-methyltransferase
LIPDYAWFVGVFMPRFYVPPETINRDRVVISGPQVHHIVNVLRLKAGDEITLFDGSGYEYRSRITVFQPGKLVVDIQAKLRPAVESPVNIVLGQALIKMDKLELVIQKATELGVSRIVPLVCARSRRIAPQVLARKQERWRRIAAEAAQQCGRIRPPRVEGLRGMDQFCADFGAAGLKLICWQQEGRRLREVLAEVEPVDEVVLLIGPEGDFEPEEVSLAQECGFIPVGLGPRTLRAETAAIAALCLIQCQLGDLS